MKGTQFVNLNKAYLNFENCVNSSGKTEQKDNP